MSDLDDLKDAQFMLGPMYCDYIWQERIKANPPVRKSAMVISFKWKAAKNVVAINSRKKQK